MKKIVLLSFVILSLSINAFAEIPTLIKVKGAIIDFELHGWAESREGGNHIDYKTPLVKFKIIEPKEYFNKTVGIRPSRPGSQILKELKMEKFDFYSETPKDLEESKIGKVCTFELPKDFLDGNYGFIYEEDIKNFKNEP